MVGDPPSFWVFWGRVCDRGIGEGGGQLIHKQDENVATTIF